MVDYVGRFENLQQDFYEICENIGIEKQSIPYVNDSSKRLNISDPIKLIKMYPTLALKFGIKKRKHSSYKNYYNENTKNQVYNLYQSDIEWLNYSFDS